MSRFSGMLVQQEQAQYVLDFEATYQKAHQEAISEASVWMRVTNQSRHTVGMMQCEVTPWA